MVTLTVSATTDFSADLLEEIDFIEFTSPATATFAASQFDNLAILDTVRIVGNGSNHIVVNGGSLDASQWQFDFWNTLFNSITLNGTAQADTITGSAAADILTGRNGNDTLTGGNGDDTITGGAGRDIIEGGDGTNRLRGGAQNDEFLFVAETYDFDLAITDTINGGTGLADKIVLQGLSSLGSFLDASISNVEILEFRSNGFATFNGDVFGPDGISMVIAPLGLVNGGILMIIEGSAVDLSAVVFTGWDDGEIIGDDRVSISGTFSADTLIGSANQDYIVASSGDDTIDGGDGNDIIHPDTGRDIVHGGAGNDRISFNTADEIETGESIDGGAGDGDVIVLELQTGIDDRVFDFAGVFVNGIEELELSGGPFGGNPGHVRIPGDLFGTTQIERVTISAPCLLEFTGSAVDLSVVAFDGTVVAEASTLLTGISGSSNILIGGTLGDTIIGSTSVDGLLGNEGDDTFIIRSNADIVAGDIIDGGADSDSIELSVTLTGVVDFSGAVIGAIERLAMLGAGQKANLTAAQAEALTEVEGSAGKQTLKVTADVIDLSALTFTNWTGIDIVKLTGTTGADDITGSSGRDIIAGLDGGDYLHAGAGDDDLIGGLGRDDMIGGEGADTFIYQSLDDTPTGTTRDRIRDFTQGEDLIVIEVPGFTFIEDNAFSGLGTAEINYEVVGLATILNLDGDGDGVAEAKIALTGAMTITNADLLLG